MQGPHSTESRQKMMESQKTKWQDPVWREQELERRKIQKENGTYAKRGQGISKTKRERNKGNSCVVGGYCVLLGYGNGGILEHRKVMEEYLGRPLEPNEIPHHCDGNKLNNDIENLELVLKSHHFSEYHPGIFKGRLATFLGQKHTKEAKEKMRLAATGRVAPNKGISPSDEVRKRMSEAQKRRHAERQKLGFGYKGKNFSSGQTFF